MNKKMTVKIFRISTKLEILDEVKLIRIKSKDYNLLIMDDYMPLLGEINGDVDIEYKDGSISLKNILAYYINSKNIFSLIIKE